MNIISTGNSALQSHLPMDNFKQIWRDDPMQIIVMLFDKSLLHISRARSTLAGWDDECYQKHILNAVEIIERLQMTLDHTKNSAMAANFDDLYRYVMSLLVGSLQQKSQKILTQAMTLLVEIRESLSIFVKKTSQMLQH